jgi:hypothetical protein
MPPTRTYYKYTENVTFADLINNNAVFDNAWDLTEYFELDLDDLNLQIDREEDYFLINEIVCIGAGTAPSNTNKEDAQILISTNNAFTEVVSFDYGKMSDATYTIGGTNYTVIVFHLSHPIYTNSDKLYFTVKAPQNATQTCTKVSIQISQEYQ